MNIGMYNPFLDTLGGGERYILTIAEYLAKNYSVSILLDDQLRRWSGKQWTKKIQDRLDINVESVKFRVCHKQKLSQQNTQDLFSEYDVFFYMTDGTIFRCRSTNSILLIQKPGFLKDIRQNTFDPLFIDTLHTWNRVVCNSFFTKSLVDEEWGVNSSVIYPPVSTLELAKSGEKKSHIILSVGRFFSGGHCKNQHTLIQVFRDLCKHGLKDWKLYLVGGAKDKDTSYLNLVQELAAGLPITIMPNATYLELHHLYQKASIYWHATGSNDDPKKYPDRMEHFGIAPVEAMSAGCVPIVYDAGGLPEIVTDWEDGFLWRNTTELANYSLRLIKNRSLRDRMSNQAIIKSRKFNKQRFCDEISKLIALSGG